MLRYGVPQGVEGKEVIVVRWGRGLVRFEVDNCLLCTSDCEEKAHVSGISTAPMVGTVSTCSGVVALTSYCLVVPSRA